MAGSILNFSKDRLITGVNIIDGMLFFTDGENEPKKINIKFLFTYLDFNSVLWIQVIIPQFICGFSKFFE